MTFYYHMYGQTVGTLNVFNDNKKVFSRSGDLGNTWNVAHIDLSGDLDVSKINVVNEANRTSILSI